MTILHQFSLIIIILASFYSKAILSSEPLPNWIDPIREKSDGAAPKHFIIPSPPSESFRLVAEYEKAKAVVLGWSGYTSMLLEIAKAAGSEGNAEIWVLSGPDSIPAIPADKHIKLPCPLNTVWMRDYGPFGITESTNSLGVVDSVYRHYAYRRLDDQVPTCIAHEQNIDVFAMNLILDGGNLLVDRHGNLFMTKRTYDWNNTKTKEEVDNLLMEYFKVKKIHALDYAGYPNYPADGTGHIDMFVKLLNDDTVLIAESENEPFKSNGQKAFEYFKGLKTPSGGDYKILRIKGWSRSGTWYTYTNSLIVNNVVLVPSFSAYSNENQKAIGIYQEGMPNVKVQLINSDSSISAGGAIHCVTQLIPAI
ncbi:MAG: hypothetical protein A2381_02215 [Bdellovibrionales bacterium RIFOXYB1_FULL_37_110]|nr:MAG: hypothetical protein A2417_13520 [Bdellovibrionales bacterium RIFOXYC1_FULL_37_79]OFZ59253.1 MAG: hypothetical protein A2381_02215 [Bdellovibrionales bacterium RIFOXYB1_FULL_37_110]OFZ62879.1 MAG: hypothetical protein A2577_11170 [Bdellovibrionales bacterium RIFOXYD1_FULL_36_51]